MSNVISLSDQVRESFDFEIDKFRLQGPDNMTTPFYGLFRSDNMEAVGKPCSKIYVPHTTDDVIALVEAAETAFDDTIEVSCHFRDGHYVSIAPSKAHRRSIANTRDDIFPRMMIRAGYDGRAFSATMGYYRDLCSNLSMMRKVKGTNVSIRHTSGLRANMNELIDTLSVLRESWDSLMDVIEAMEQRTVNMASFLDSIYGTPDADASQNSVTRHKNRTEAIFRRLWKEQSALGQPHMSEANGWQTNAWLAYNAVQGYVQHDAPGKKSHNGTFDRILRASSDRAVQQAEAILTA